MEIRVGNATVTMIAADDSVISFTTAKKPYGWLGNMSPHPVKHEGKRWPTTEHLFQALRFPYGSPIREMIRKQPNPMDAKRISAEYKKQRAIESRSEEDLVNMRYCLGKKIEDHPDLRKKLLATKGKFLIEDVSGRANPNDPWGMQRFNDVWIGKNLLGNLWMELRDTLKPNIKFF